MLLILQLIGIIMICDVTVQGKYLITWLDVTLVS